MCVVDVVLLLSWLPSKLKSKYCCYDLTETNRINRFVRAESVAEILLL